MKTRPKIRRSEELVVRIAPILANQGADVQSVVLAELLSMWIIGHHPDLRREALEMHVKLTCDLVAANLAKRDPYATIQ